MPSGFSLEFSRSGETGIFGSKGDRPDKALKWTNANVVGQRAQFLGVTYDANKAADFLSFHMCAGGLTLAPSPVPVVEKVVQKQSGCFNGPMAGKYNASTS